MAESSRKHSRLMMQKTSCFPPRVDPYPDDFPLVEIENEFVCVCQRQYGETNEVVAIRIAEKLTEHDERYRLIKKSIKIGVGVAIKEHHNGETFFYVTLKTKEL